MVALTRVAFVTDSTAYLTPEQAEQFEITVVPLSVVFEGQAYREGVELSNAEFYQRLGDAPALPTTSQPPVGEFVAVFERLLACHDVVMCLLLSGNLSGTLQSAAAAADMVAGRVIVVDSKIASYGIAGPLMDGVEMARTGASPDEITSYWERVRAKVQSRFVLDTLENLKKGGRIGGAAALMGALLQIKPILTVIGGRIELYEKVRTYHKALAKMLSDFDRDAAKGTPLRVGVVHARREQEATELLHALQTKYPQGRFELGELGPVLGTHTGPGAMALLWYEVEGELQP